jgi:hypothetical protein
MASAVRLRVSRVLSVASPVLLRVSPVLLALVSAVRFRALASALLPVTLRVILVSVSAR